MLDSILGNASITVFSFRLSCVFISIILLKAYKVEKFQFPILIFVLSLNLLYFFYQTSLSMNGTTGFAIALTMLSILPISLKKYLVLYFMTIVAYVVNGAIIVSLLGRQEIADMVTASGSFFVIFLIYIFVNKCRQLLAESDKLLLSKNNILNEKNNFLVNMYDQLVHDVQSPLMALKFLSNKSEDENNLLSQATGRVEKIILELKNESKVKENDQFNIVERLNYLISELIIRYHEKKNVDIKVSIDNSLRVDMVSFNDIDIQQFSRVISNLFNNSVEACSSDICSIKVSLKEVNHNIHIEISDNGPGVSEGLIDNILNKKFTTKIDGMGLGLSAAREVVVTSGGSLNISSDKGFKVELVLIKSTN